ncbi:hypothetical protein CR513_38401, partial [Mucuna pruriens]
MTASWAFPYADKAYSPLLLSFHEALKPVSIFYPTRDLSLATSRKRSPSDYNYVCMKRALSKCGSTNSMNVECKYKPKNDQLRYPRSTIRRLGQDEVVSAKTDSISARPDQTKLHGLSAQVGLRLGSQSLPEGTDWDSQHTLVNLILNAQAIGGEPSPSAVAIVIDFSRNHPGLVSAESNSASGRDESIFYISDSTSFHSILSHKRAHCVLEKNDLGLRKIRNAAVNTSSSIDSVVDSNQFYTDNFVSSSNIFAEPEQMENNDRTLKELATPDVVYQPWCIQYPQLEPAKTYKLSLGLYTCCLNFMVLQEKPPQASKGIPCGLLHNEAVGDIGRLYQNEGFPILRGWSSKGLAFFPASRTTSIRKEICGIRQHTGETLHEYWERFNKLCATCPHHQISEQLLIQYFYEGLSMMDRSMIDAASGGALMDKTPAAARHLISNMASNTQQFGIRGPSQTRMVNEIGAASNQRLENQLTKLTSLVRQLTVGQHQPAMAAKTESDQTENVGAIGGFQYRKHSYHNRPFDSQQHGRQPFRPGPNQGPYAAQQFGSTPNTYQRQAGYQQPTPQYQVPPFQQQQQQQRMPTQGNSPSLEDLMKQLATSNLEFQQSVSSNNMQFQQNMTTTIQDLKTQIGQLANTVSQLQSAGSSNLPSQTIPNPRGNASVVTLRSGKELPQPTLQQLPRSAEADSKPNVGLYNYSTAISISDHLGKEIIMFRKVEINILLLDAIKQVTKYAKFLKELCVHKRRKIKGSREIGGVVSALTRNEAITVGAPTLPKKCRDPGIFSIPCTIGECTFADAMLDLGASINVMPASIYRSLNFGDLEPTGMTIQLQTGVLSNPWEFLRMFSSKSTN